MKTCLFSVFYLFLICRLFSQTKFDCNYFVENYIDVNTAYSELSIIPYDNESLIIVSDRGIMDRKKIWSGNSPYNMYLFYPLSDSIEIMSPKLNSMTTNVGPATVLDPEFLFFTATNPEGFFDKSKKEEVYSLCIKQGNLVNGKWETTFIESLADKKYSFAHPSISADGNTLYFVSNLPGGYGATDIYKCELTPRGWSEPINLGSKINTQFEEQFPFYHENGYLFFSSRQKEFGVASLDIYVSKKIGSNEWEQSINMGEPINTRGDEFQIYLDKEMQSGYVSSNRIGGKGSDDIYKIDKRGSKTEEKETVAMLPKKDVTISNVNPVSEKNNSIQNETSPVIVNQTNTNSNSLQNEMKTALLEKIKGFKTMVTAVEDLKLQNVYFASKSSELSEESAQIIKYLSVLLKNNPKVYLEIHAHADARGNYVDNINLSENRARTVMSSLELNGISSKRMKYLPYGESDLLIQNESDIELNRRVEFKFNDKEEKVYETKNISPNNVTKNIEVLEGNKYYVQIASVYKTNTTVGNNLQAFGVPQCYIEQELSKYVFGPFHNYLDALIKLTELKQFYPDGFIFLNELEEM